MYQVVYIENGQPDQVLTRPLDFQAAHDMAIGIAADDFKSGGNPKEVAFVVQPVTLVLSCLLLNPTPP